MSARSARSPIVAALGGDSASELPLELRLQEAYRQQLVDELAGAATANGEFVLNNLLSLKDALTLVGPGNQLHLDDYARWADTLHLEDWRRMLNAAAPNMSSPLWDSTVWSQRLAGAVFETLPGPAQRKRRHARNAPGPELLRLTERGCGVGVIAGSFGAVPAAQGIVGGGGAHQQAEFSDLVRQPQFGPSATVAPDRSR